MKTAQTSNNYLKQITRSSKSYCDAVVIGISNDLVLDLFPSFEAPVNEDLTAAREYLPCNLDQLITIIRETGTKSAEGVACTQKHRESKLQSISANYESQRKA